MVLPPVSWPPVQAHRLCHCGRLHHADLPALDAGAGGSPFELRDPTFQIGANAGGSLGRAVEPVREAAAAFCRTGADWTLFQPGTTGRRNASRCPAGSPRESESW